MNTIFKCNNLHIRENDETLICGILNVTPDSFSDGGRYYDTDSALQRALKLVADGADMIDIGGESTRPGSTPISDEEEIKRVVPVIKAIKSHPELRTVPLSIDTFKSSVARAAIKAGVDIVNDITGLLGDSEMANVVAETGAGLIIMFNPVIMRPEFESSKKFRNFIVDDERYFEDLDTEKMDISIMMETYFKTSLSVAKKAGIDEKKIMLDEGIGFGLTKNENLSLLKAFDDIKNLGFASFLGVSRKRFLANLLGENGIDIDMKTEQGLSNMDIASSFVSAIAAFSSVNVLRVHDIPKHKQAVIIGNAIRRAGLDEDVILKSYKE